MTRYLIDISYDGTAYAGWQRQLNANTVQEECEKALMKALGQHVAITGASRTDAGVHALGQRAHFDCETSIPADKFPFVFNSLLPRDIRVTGAQQVPDSLHARFAAGGKRYRYDYHNSRHASALLRDFSWHVPQPLDVDAMRQAAGFLLGRHDFSGLKDEGGSAKTTVRTIDRLELSQQGASLSLIVEGDAFLYHMVRVIAGSLCWVGIGKMLPAQLQEALRQRDRLLAGPTAPAHGLTLCKIWYPSLGENADDE